MKLTEREMTLIREAINFRLENARAYLALGRPGMVKLSDGKQVRATVNALVPLLKKLHGK